MTRAVLHFHIFGAFQYFPLFFLHSALPASPRICRSPGPTHVCSPSSPQKRCAARPEIWQHNRPTTKPDRHKSTVDAATHPTRVPFQRRHALAGRHVPHLELIVPAPRNDAPPVRRYGNTFNLQRRHITRVLQKQMTRAARSPCALSA